MDDTEYVTIEVLGSEYENEWDLLAGEYKFRISSSMKSLVFKSKIKVVTIDRSFIKDYGIRVRNREKLYFFSLGRRSPFGKGDIVIRSLGFGVEKFNYWVRERMITSKAKMSATLSRPLMMNKPSRLSHQYSSFNSKSSSTSDLSNPLAKISHFLGMFKGSKKKKKKSKGALLLLPGEEYSEVDDNLTSCTNATNTSYQSYQYQTAEDASDTDTGGLVLPPLSSTNKKTVSSSKSFRSRRHSPNKPCDKNHHHPKWHEMEETYSEYVPEYSVPMDRTNDNEIMVAKSGDIYRLPEPKNKSKVLVRKTSLDEKSSAVVDYYNTATESLYYNLESRLISKEDVDEDDNE